VKGPDDDGTLLIICYLCLDSLSIVQLVFIKKENLLD
jgi:hypothetical protein